MLKQACRLNSVYQRLVRSIHSQPDALNVTTKAVQKLRQIAEDGEFLRISVEGGGCSGFEYKLKLDKQKWPDDVLIEKGGANVVVDELSLDFIRGSTIDYTEDLMRSAFRITDNPLSTQGCSCGVSFAPKEFDDQKEKSSNDESKHDDKKKGGGSTSTKPLLAITLVGMIKNFFTFRPDLDDHPIKNKIKQAMLFRNRGEYDQALLILEELLEQVKAEKDEILITRAHYEIAYTYFMQDNLDKAEEFFRIVISRLIQLHGKTDTSPEFINISLKLADIFARRGELENAEIGYRHCVTKQMAIMEEHLKSYFISKGAAQEHIHKVETYGHIYGDPIALFGMCLEQFAHFLINYCDASREEEACEYMDEVLKVSHHLYGPSSYHCVNILNNFGAACILRNRFEIAKRYLEIGIERVLYINECSDIIVGYYCNYAEALFHCGEIDEALKYAEKAVTFSKSAPENLQRYAKNYLKDVKRDQWKAREEIAKAKAIKAPKAVEA